SFATSFLAGASQIFTAINVISIVILLIMMLILGNTIAMGVRERTNEYGVLKALGFSSGHLAMFVLAEATILGLAGAALGVLIAYPFIENGLGRWLEENMGSIFPYFRIDPRAVIASLGAGVLLALLAASIPATRASRLHVVDALRRVA